MQKENSKKVFFKKTILLFRPFYKYFAIALSMLFIVQIIGTFSPYLFGKSIDAVTKGDIRLTFIFLTIAFFISLFQSQVLSHLKDWIEVKYLDSNVEKYFHVNALEKMMSFSIGQHINEHSGVKQTIVNKGQSSLTNFMYQTIYGILPSALQIIATLSIITFLDWRIALVAVTFVSLYIYFALKGNKVFFPKIDEIRKKHQAQGKLQSELYRNSTLVISEAQESATKLNFQNSWNNASKFFTDTWISFFKMTYSHRLFILLGQYLSLGLGAYLILIGEHSVGTFVTLFAWISSIFSNLTTIVNNQRQMLFQFAEIKKYFDLLDIVPDIDLNPNGKVIENLQGKIEFKNISFAYPYRKSAAEEESESDEEEDKKEDHAVSGINLTIPAGAKVGFVGASGSGKSTIVNLMRRYYKQTEGEILIDGVPIEEVNIRWFRSTIGNVEQKIDLFDRSIKDNILFGLPENKTATEEEINKVITDASLDDFITKLKDHGLDTMIGEGGIKVSGGERQRIGIARALIKDPKILIFDEATSALDSINEKLIHESINRGSKGRTTVIIAHRLSTIMDADKIFVVSEGKIVGEGTHTELSKSCKEYKDLLEHQVFVL